MPTVSPLSEWGEDREVGPISSLSLSPSHPVHLHTTAVQISLQWLESGCVCLEVLLPWVAD